MTKAETSTHQLSSRSPLNSARVKWASCSCSTSRRSPWFDLTRFLVNTSNSSQAARRATRWRTCRLFPRRPRGAEGRGGVIKPGQWSQDQPLAPANNKLPHWLDKLSIPSLPAHLIGQEWDGWRDRARRAVNRTHAAFTRNRILPRTRGRQFG